MRNWLLWMGLAFTMALGAPLSAQSSGCDKTDSINRYLGMTFSVNSPSVEDMFFQKADKILNATGKFCPNTAREFEIFLFDNGIIDESGYLKSEDVIQVNLKSYGGSVSSALEFGRIIRRLNLNTDITEFCESSCAYAYMGGRYRFYHDGVIGLHRLAVVFEKDTPVFQKDEISSQIQQGASASILSYMDEMGVNRELFLKAVMYGSETYKVPYEQAELWGLANNGTDKSTSTIFIDNKRKPIFRIMRTGLFDDIIIEITCENSPVITIKATKKGIGRFQSGNLFGFDGFYGYVRQRHAPKTIFFFDTREGTIWGGEKNLQFYRQWREVPKSVTIERSNAFGQEAEYAKWDLRYEKFKPGRFGSASDLTLAVVEPKLNSVDPTKGIEVLHTIDLRPVRSDSRSFLSACTGANFVF